MSGRNDSRDRRPGANNPGANNPGAGGPGDTAGADDDARLWESVARSVTPLARTGRLPPVAAPAPPAPEKAPEKAPAEAAGDPKAAPESEVREPVDISGLRIGAKDRPAAQSSSSAPGSSGLSYGDAPGVDRRTATRFRRGLMPIDATLDLHGHTQASGRTATCEHHDYLPHFSAQQ